MSQNNRKEANNKSATNLSHQEAPNTYFVQDKASVDEMTRLHIQGQLLTESQGGILSEQPDPTPFQTVLDVGCSTGNWLIEAAKTYPTMKRLVGIDISTRMLDYARGQAQAQGLSDRVEFAMMDTLRLLEFPDQTFDLVNLRSGTGYLRKWDWPGLLREFQRVCQAGGVVRVTEVDFLIASSSPALNQLNQLIFEAFWNAGHLFVHDKHGVLSHLEHLLTQYGLLDVQTSPLTLQYQAGAPGFEYFVEDMKRGYQAGLPFLRKWIRVPDTYDAIYQQALQEMQQPDFVATWDLLTAWGTNSDRVISSRD